MRLTNPLTQLSYCIGILLIVLTIGCKEQPGNNFPAEKPEELTQNQIEGKEKRALEAKKKRERRATGIKEFEKLSKRKFSADSVFVYDIAKIYEIDCGGECFASSLFRERGEKEKTLSRKEFKQLMEVIDKKSTYTFNGAACFHPKVGVVTYNEEQYPLVYYGICLECNNYTTNLIFEFSPYFDKSLGKKRKLYGFSKSGRKQIRNVLREINFEYPFGGYSGMFDDSLIVRSEMIELGLDSTELEKQIDGIGFQYYNNGE